VFVVALVALAALGRPIEEEISPLAALLGTTPYEAGLVLRAPMPLVVARTEDKARALAIASRLRERGHEVVALDTGTVVDSDAMTPIRLFRFEDGALVAIAQNGTEARAPYAEMVAIVRAMHVKRSESVMKEKETAISVGRAVLTGGLLATKTVEKQRTHKSEERESVVYVFRRDGEPWLLRAGHARYDGLGADLKPTVIENLTTFVRLLRARAPHAVVDERLLAVKNVDPNTLDVLASVVAVAVSRRATAYRGARGTTS
jgi:hypothetical protein